MVWLYRNSMLLWRHVHLSVLVSGFWAFCLWLSSSTELTLFCCMKQIELLQMILWWNWCKGILVDLALFLLLSQNREVLFNLLEFGCKKWGFLAYGKLGQSTGGRFDESYGHVYLQICLMTPFIVCGSFSGFRRSEWLLYQCWCLVQLYKPTIPIWLIH